MTVDALIAGIAARQHRVAAHRQLRAAGVGAGAIRHRVERSRLFVQHRGVYSVGVADPGRLGVLFAAVLACGDAAVLSHRSNAVLWGVLRHRPGPVHVLVPGRRGSGGRRGILLRGSRSLAPVDTTTRLKIPCTTVERTLVDIAGGPPAELKRAVEQAFVLHLIGRTRMADTLERARGRAGIGRLRRLLGGLLEDMPLTRSELERRFLRLVDRAGLPPPVVNRHRESHRVDFHWPASRLVVETDGRAVHDNPLAFERDRARDLDLELAGWHVIRLSWRQVAERPGPATALLRARLNEDRRPCVPFPAL